MFAISGLAQNKKASKAEKEYKKFSYSKAIEKYEKTDTKTTEVKRQLAESYYISGNTEKAEEYYMQVVNSPDVKPEDFYRYSSILRVNGKYDRSDMWIKLYADSRKTDSRVTEWLANPGASEKLTKDEGRYQLKNLDVNSAQQDFGTSYCGNKLTFASSREDIKPAKMKWNGNGLSFLDIYVGDIVDSGQLVSVSSFNKKVNKKYHEGPAAFSEDGKTMIFTRNNYDAKASDGTTNLQLYYAELVDGEWKNEESLPFNNKDYSFGHPSLSPDGKILYFASNMEGGFGGTDIYKSVKKDLGVWTQPENLGNKINTEGNEMFPFYHPNGVLFFASDGHVGLGGLDVFVSQIKSEGYGKAVNIGYPANTSKDDFAFVLNKEMKSGYLSSNRVGGKGNDDIYAFNLLKPFVFGKIIRGIAKDKEDKALQASVVVLRDENGKEVEKITTGNDGAYSFSVDADKNFKLTGNKDKYFEGANKANTFGKEDVVTADVVLEKDPGLSLYGLISDAKTKEPLEGVNVLLIDNMTGKEVINQATPASGDFRRPLTDKKIKDRLSYQIKLSKAGYLSKAVVFNTEIVKEGEIKVHEALNVTLEKIEVGADLAKLIDIKPIYFDLSKYNIRKDAAIELDKIVKVMNENPSMEVELGSHTDCRSSAASNMALSDKRAKASAEYVKMKITKPERIYGKGYGESHLINKCECEGAVKIPCTEQEHQANRRTEFKITKM